MLHRCRAVHMLVRRDAPKLDRGVAGCRRGWRRGVTGLNVGARMGVAGAMGERDPGHGKNHDREDRGGYPTESFERTGHDC